MVILTSVIILMMLLGTGSACAEEMMTFQEVESYLYADGKMERSDGRFEIVYFFEGDTITRIRVMDLKNNEMNYDKTTFHIDRKLRSDPTKGLASQRKSVVRAVGRPGIDGVEILSITDQFMVSVRSTSDFIEISRSRRIK
jgi:hypothetical protein